MCIRDRIDRFIWEEACKKLKEWSDNGYDNLSISVNVSRINLYNNNLADKMCIRDSNRIYQREME